MRIAARCLALAALLALAPAAALAAKNPIAGTGTILHLGPAAHAYAIQADDGATYEPANLGKIYRQDGLRVRFKAKHDARHRPLVAGAQPVRITHMAVLPDGPPKPRTAPTRIQPSR
jgi:hypothetical protein